MESLGHFLVSHPTVVHSQLKSSYSTVHGPVQQFAVEGEQRGEAGHGHVEGQLPDVPQAKEKSIA